MSVSVSACPCSQKHTTYTYIVCTCTINKLVQHVSKVCSLNQNPQSLVTSLTINYAADTPVSGYTGFAYILSFLNLIFVMVL